MPIQKESIGKRVARLKKSHPKRDTSTGLMYTTAAQKNKQTQTVTLWGLFVSDEGTFLLRPHLFESKKDKRTPRQWNAWFAEHYGTILVDVILPGMEDRTDKQWRLYRIIGWTQNADTRAKNTATHKARNKTKPKRR